VSESRHIGEKGRCPKTKTAFHSGSKPSYIVHPLGIHTDLQCRGSIQRAAPHSGSKPSHQANSVGINADLQCPASFQTSAQRSGYEAIASHKINWKKLQKQGTEWGRRQRAARHPKATEAGSMFSGLCTAKPSCNQGSRQSRFGKAMPALTVMLVVVGGIAIAAVHLHGPLSASKLSPQISA